MQKAGRIEWVLLFSCVLIWGSSFILMKKALLVFPPDEVAAIRLTAAGICLLPFSMRAILKRGFQVWPWGKLTLSCMLGNFIPAFLFALALTGVDSGTSGVLNSLTPLWTLVMGVAFFGMQAGRFQVMGIVLGWFGAILLLMTRPSSGGETNYDLGMLIVLATVMYGTNANFVKKYLSELRALTLTSLALGIGAVPAGLYLLTTDVTSRMSVPGSGQALLAALALGCIGTAFALSLFFALLRRCDPLFASSVTYFMPIVALALALADGETLQLLHMLGLSLILGGVWLVNRRRVRVASSPRG